MFQKKVSEVGTVNSVFTPHMEDKKPGAKRGTPNAGP
jgi:hypothetical protein